MCKLTDWDMMFIDLLKIKQPYAQYRKKDNKYLYFNKSYSPKELYFRVERFHTRPFNGEKFSYESSSLLYPDDAIRMAIRREVYNSVLIAKFEYGYSWDWRIGKWRIAEIDAKDGK